MNQPGSRSSGSDRKNMYCHQNVSLKGLMHLVVSSTPEFCLPRFPVSWLERALCTNLIQPCAVICPRICPCKRNFNYAIFAIPGLSQDPNPIPARSRHVTSNAVTAAARRGRYEQRPNLAPNRTHHVRTILVMSEGASLLIARCV